MANKMKKVNSLRRYMSEFDDIHNLFGSAFRLGHVYGWMARVAVTVSSVGGLYDIIG